MYCFHTGWPRWVHWCCQSSSSLFKDYELCSKRRYCFILCINGVLPVTIGYILTGRSCVLSDDWTSVTDLINIFQRLLALQVWLIMVLLSISSPTACFFLGRHLNWEVCEQRKSPEPDCHSLTLNTCLWIALLLCLLDWSTVWCSFIRLAFPLEFWITRGKAVHEDNFTYRIAGKLGRRGKPNHLAPNLMTQHFLDWLQSRFWPALAGIKLFVGYLANLNVDSWVRDRHTYICNKIGRFY